jgi:signal transduction histidine kinase
VISAPAPRQFRVAGFRTKLRIAMMLVVSGMTALALYYAQRNLAASAARALRREFQGELAALGNIQEVRHAALVERCRALVRKPRIHAALEDNALDLLYPSAKDELRDIMAPPIDAGAAPSELHAQFYRFLDGKGAVISPPTTKDVGMLSPAEEARLALNGVPQEQQIGYLSRSSGTGVDTLSEIIAMPIISSESGEVIAAIVLGFKPTALAGVHPGAGIRSGIWVDGRLHLASFSAPAIARIGTEVAGAVRQRGSAEKEMELSIEGAPHLLFYKQINPGSLFPPAYEVCVFPLSELIVQQRQVGWQVLGAGGLLLCAGLVASHFLSVRLSRPVEKLAVDSEEDRAQRQRAEAALESTSEELQRAARFSADASHQLKTPVTVLRAGLEELMTRENLTPEECAEISALIHQTYRLSSVIEDLLLLSRMDAGRLKLEFGAVNLTALIEAALDDLGAMPDSLELQVETDFSDSLLIAGEKRYTVLILQNLLENARKYNRRGGRIRVAAREKDGWVTLEVGNTGRAISPAAQEHIFERFHRGGMGENVPGYGLGLNLARELARLHEGNLRLVRSDESWTEFEVRFRSARVVQPLSSGVAT